MAVLMPAAARMKKAVARMAKSAIFTFLLDLLADVLRCPSDHQPGNEDRQNRVEQDAVETRADAAEDHLAGLDIEQRHQPAERRVAVVHAVDRAAAGVGRHGGKERRP